MTSWAYTAEKQSYKDAVAATESIEAPAVGFARPAEYRNTLASLGAVTKQNNTILVILTELTEKVNFLQLQVQQLQQQVLKGKAPENLEQSISDLSNKLAGLKVDGADSAIPKKKGVLYVYQKPSDILDREKARK
ncbi:P2 [Jujube mosaic-associated virus]|uniref:P2 n=1 Tax=Jujube mosaic-associated virus TaxID=2020956 RepID=A0A221C9F6_9VIRU|nr:P2 [Jujube mosaic-associated virus]ASL69988.1 P2 [Jujube mosaic-associated virus]